MNDSEILRTAIFDAIETQIATNNPAETSITLKRLVADGYSKSDARILIWPVCCS